MKLTTQRERNNVKKEVFVFNICINKAAFEHSLNTDLLTTCTSVLKQVHVHHVYLWYWAWRNWNSSLMRSRVSRTVNLKDWPGCKGTCRGEKRKLKEWMNRNWDLHLLIQRDVKHCLWVQVCVNLHVTHTHTHIHRWAKLWMCVYATWYKAEKKRKEAWWKCEERSLPLPTHHKASSSASLFSSYNDSAFLPSSLPPSLPPSFLSLSLSPTLAASPLCQVGNVFKPTKS